MRRRGVAVPTALFFVLLLFFLCTVLARQAQMNLRFGRQDAERTRRQYVARAAVNEMIAALNKDSSRENCGPSNPYRSSEAGMAMEAWVEADPNFPTVLHIHGRAYPEGEPGQAETFHRTVNKVPAVDGLVVTKSPFYLPDDPDAVVYKTAKDATWQLLDLAPRAYYTPDGTLHQQPGKVAGALAFLCADSKGTLYAQYAPGMDLQVMKWFAAGCQQGIDQGRTVQQLYLFLNGFIDTLTGWAPAAPTDAMPTLMAYSFSEGDWEVLPPIPNASPTGPLTGDYAPPGIPGPMASDGDNLYLANWRRGDDALYKLDLVQKQWSVIPPPPNRYYNANGTLVTGAGLARSCVIPTVDGQGTLYAEWGGDQAVKGNAIYKLEPQSGEWQILPPIPRQYYDANGQLQTRSGAALEYTFQATADGTLYAAWFTADELGAGKVPLDCSVLKFSGGAWTAVPPPPVPNTNKMVDNIAVDSDGALIVKCPSPTDPDLIYRCSGTAQEVLPPIPDQRYDNQGQLVSSPGLGNRLLDLTGGGVPIAGQYNYRPAATF